MLREIGSEFWLSDIEIAKNLKVSEWNFFGNDTCLLFSGRTAIDFVLMDIHPKINSVYMPSYCCESMLKPFIDRSILIEFYSVTIRNGNLVYSIDYDKRCDVFFAMSYFGFSCTTMDMAIQKYSDKGAIVIEDITHRLLSEKAHGGADYSIASLRKWFALPAGGLAIKRTGKFREHPLKDSFSLVDIKINAMRKKADYIYKENNNQAKHSGEKQGFLREFKEFEKKLATDYSFLLMDKISQRLLFSISIDFVKKSRRENAYYLYKRLRTSMYVKPLISKFDFSNDCPLFFPILIDFKLRERLLQHLINEEIYCPIHWPLSVHHTIDDEQRDIYQHTMSLVCDQRYNIYDMQRILDQVTIFIETRGS